MAEKNSLKKMGVQSFEEVWAETFWLDSVSNIDISSLRDDVFISHLNFPTLLDSERKPCMENYGRLPKPTQMKFVAR